MIVGLIPLAICIQLTTIPSRVMAGAAKSGWLPGRGGPIVIGRADANRCVRKVSARRFLHLGQTTPGAHRCLHQGLQHQRHPVRLDQVRGPSKTPQIAPRASVIPGTSPKGDNRCRSTIPGRRRQDIQPAQLNAAVRKVNERAARFRGHAKELIPWRVNACHLSIRILSSLRSAAAAALASTATNRSFLTGRPSECDLLPSEGKEKVTVVSEQSKEAVVAILGPDEFFGEVCLAGRRSAYRRRW